MKTAENWKNALAVVARPEKVEIYQRFFKTAPGEYAEGDIFIGVTVPDNRAIAREYFDAPTEVLQQMLDSPIHEHRISALFAMVAAYNKSKVRNPERRDEIVRLYLANLHRCNNWDLVDLSAPYILGAEVATGRCGEIQDRLAQSEAMWECRVGIVSNLHLIQKHRIVDRAIRHCSLNISATEPLIQKAVGWVMREVGKKDLAALLDFLDEHIDRISATTLSYATEKLTIDERHQWQKRRKMARI